MVFPTADSLQFNFRNNHLKQPMHRLPTVGAEGFCSKKTLSICRCNDYQLPKKQFTTADATIINSQRNSLQLPMQRLSTAGATHFTERKSVQLIGEQHKRATHAFAPRPTEDTFHLTSQYCPHTNFQPREMTSKPPVPYIYTRAPANGDRYKDKDIAKALPKKCCGRTPAINFN